ncbi:MAG: tRNA (adenosine(37)-N6)-threonylcarbamoyltransferase complex ATPase subunit type 1 TsaE [Candidatus Babeliales bacterium]
MKHEIIVGLENIQSVVEQLYKLMDRCKVFTFEGPLGAGKTTIIQLLLKKCGVDEAITSPTFTYVNVYENNRKELFYHFDLYRLHTLDEFFAQGFDEFLYLENSWAFVEWPEIIFPLLKKDVCRVTIDYAENSMRLVVLQVD